MSNIIGYIRVSTQRQRKSGLSCEAQQQALADYRQQNGGRILAVYTETETGKVTADERPELAKAIAHAKRSGAVLCVAKLDRLARKADFLLALQSSGLPMVFLDLPGANEFTIGVMALVAQHEAMACSERTRAALQAYKRRGGKLGASLPQWRNLTDKARAKGRRIATKVISQKAREAYADILPSMAQWRETMTLQGIADRLNEQGHTTRRGRPWSEARVKQIIDRAAAYRALAANC